MPLDELVTVRVGATPADIERLVAKRGFSRFPVLNAVGRARRLSPPQGRPLRRRTRSATSRCRRSGSAGWRPSVPTDEVEDVLQTMQQTGSHLARVVARDGRILGVVFLEDVLEELVGEVSDSTQR